MPSKAELVCVAPHHAKGVWPHVKQHIQSALEHTKLTPFEVVERAILEGRQLLWLAWDGERIKAAASTLIERDVCVITACGGDGRAGWLGLIAGIEQYAKDAGCRATRIIGRRGWARVLPAYKSKYVILERPV